jgi:hypothetical protein
MARRTEQDAVGPTLLGNLQDFLERLEAIVATYGILLVDAEVVVSGH